MSAITCDTLKFMESLMKSGLPENQAKAIVKAFSAAQHEAEFATKSDIKDLEHRLQDLEYRLTIKMGAMLTVVVGLVVTLSKIL